MTTSTARGWDRDLQRFAERLERDIVRDGVHLRRDVQARDSVPLFLSRGFDRQSYEVTSRAELADAWATDPDNGPEDWRLIEQLRRTDLPPGSFFILVYPAGHPVYHWLLHEPGDERS
jgi:hypothetical protein